MKLILYKNYSEDIVVSKNIGDAIEIDGYIRDTSGVSISDPVFEVQRGIGIINYNYAYVEEFDRYYFIQNIDVGVNGLITLFMHVDVLMSKKDEWLENTGFLDTTLNYANFYLFDPNTPIQQNTQITTVKEFQTPLGGFSIIMNATNVSSAVSDESSEET